MFKMKLNIPISKKSRIEMLPLIDIVFLVLVFFIYAMLSMAAHRGLPVVLPVSSSAKIDKRLALSVTLKADGMVYLDKEKVALESLTELLKNKIQGHKDAGVFLFADAGISYQNLFRVLDNIRLAGINNISLQAEVDG
jgi:biopolymer transport protein ExbD